MIKANEKKTQNININSLLLERQTDYLKESLSLAIKYDIVSSIEDAIRFYSYSLDILNLSGDNHKLEVLEKIRNCSVRGIDKDDYEKIKTYNGVLYAPVPLVFTSSLLSILSKHIQMIENNTNGNNEIKICMFLILPSSLYDQLALLNSSLVKYNARMVCDDNESKITDIEKQFCNVTIENFDPNGDLDGDGILNKDDCDMDGDNETAPYNIFTHKPCNITNRTIDLDDNNDGIYDKVENLKPVNITLNPDVDYSSLNITPTYDNSTNTTYVTLYLPYSPYCEEYFSNSLRNMIFFYSLNPFYIFLMPFNQTQNDYKNLNIEDDFDYQNSYFYVYIAPIYLYIKSFIDENNYNEVHLFLNDIWKYYDIGIYRQTSECDGSPPGC